MLTFWRNCDITSGFGLDGMVKYTDVVCILKTTALCTFVVSKVIDPPKQYFNIFLKSAYSKINYYMTNSYRPGIKKFDWFKAGL